MKTIGDVLNYDELKNFGTITSCAVLNCVMYKAIYDDYPISESGVFYFTDPDVGLSFDPLAMRLGKLPFLIDSTYTVPKGNGYTVPEIHKCRSESPFRERGTGTLSEECESVHDICKRTLRNSKFKSFYKCKDLDRFLSELKPVSVMANSCFINYDNKTLYSFTTQMNKDGEIEFNFMLIYGHATNIGKELDFFKDYFEPVDDVERQPNTFYYLFRDRGGLNTQSLEMDFYDITSNFIMKNYNDDLPYDKIERFVDGDESGICLLHGEPGTGKSTFIKHLIGKHTECNFYYIPSSLMNQVDENELANYLLRSQSKSVYIIEDCEALISDRNKGSNPILPTLLNFSDGIVSGALKPKFILTFNCPISQIDKAVLRKGRLKIKYDFKPLCLEKTKLLYPEATGPMPLCDIYNQEDNGVEAAKKRIGFTS